jgi:tryptophan-rich sensory protein
MAKSGGVNREWLIPIIVVVIFTLLAIAISYPALRFNWYSSLNKPPGIYPLWLYNPLWYLFYGITLWCWYRLSLGTNVSLAVSRYNVLYHVLFSIIVGLTVLWMVVFFYWKDIYGAIVILLIEVILIAVLMVSVASRRVLMRDPLSIFLLALMMIWIFYNIYITWYLYRLNATKFDKD